MKFKLISSVILCLISITLNQPKAQTNYLAEIGVNLGSFYLLGDGNAAFFKNQQFDYGIMYRHNFNERLSAHVDWNNSRIIVPQPGFSDTTRVNMLDVCGEFNFFDIVKRQYKPQSRSFSPYLFAGIGLATSDYGLSMGIPFGMGIKYKAGSRITFNAKWAHRLMFNDKINGIDNPYLLNGTNILNNDLLSTFTVGISFNFWKKACDCNTY